MPNISEYSSREDMDPRNPAPPQQQTPSSLQEQILGEEYEFDSQGILTIPNENSQMQIKKDGDGSIIEITLGPQNQDGNNGKTSPLYKKLETPEQESQELTSLDTSEIPEESENIELDKLKTEFYEYPDNVRIAIYEAVLTQIQEQIKETENFDLSFISPYDIAILATASEDLKGMINQESGSDTERLTATQLQQRLNGILGELANKKFPENHKFDIFINGKNPKIKLYELIKDYKPAEEQSNKLADTNSESEKSTSESKKSTKLAQKNIFSFLESFTPKGPKEKKQRKIINRISNILFQLQEGNHELDNIRQEAIRALSDLIEATDYNLNSYHLLTLAIDSIPSKQIDPNKGKPVEEYLLDLYSYIYTHRYARLEISEIKISDLDNTGKKYLKRLIKDTLIHFKPGTNSKFKTSDFAKKLIQYALENHPAIIKKLFEDSKYKSLSLASSIIIVTEEESEERKDQQQTNKNETQTPEQLSESSKTQLDIVLQAYQILFEELVYRKGRQLIDQLLPYSTKEKFIQNMFEQIKEIYQKETNEDNKIKIIDTINNIISITLSSNDSDITQYVQNELKSIFNDPEWEEEDKKTLVRNFLKEIHQRIEQDDGQQPQDQEQKEIHQRIEQDDGQQPQDQEQEETLQPPSLDAIQRLFNIIPKDLKDTTITINGQEITIDPFSNEYILQFAIQHLKGNEESDIFDFIRDFERIKDITMPGNDGKEYYIVKSLKTALKEYIQSSQGNETEDLVLELIKEMLEKQDTFRQYKNPEGRIEDKSKIIIDIIETAIDTYIENPENNQTNFQNLITHILSMDDSKQKLKDRLLTTINDKFKKLLDNIQTEEDDTKRKNLINLAKIQIPGTNSNSTISFFQYLQQQNKLDELYDILFNHLFQYEKNGELHASPIQELFSIIPQNLRGTKITVNGKETTIDPFSNEYILQFAIQHLKGNEESDIFDFIRDFERIKDITMPGNDGKEYYIVKSLKTALKEYIQSSQGNETEDLVLELIKEMLEKQDTFRQYKNPEGRIEDKSKIIIDIIETAIDTYIENPENNQTNFQNLIQYLITLPESIPEELKEELSKLVKEKFIELLYKINQLPPKDSNLTDLLNLARIKISTDPEKKELSFFQYLNGKDNKDDLFEVLQAIFKYPNPNEQNTFYINPINNLFDLLPDLDHTDINGNHTKGLELIEILLDLKKDQIPPKWIDPIKSWLKKQDLQTLNAILTHHNAFLSNDNNEYAFRDLVEILIVQLRIKGQDTSNIPETLKLLKKHKLKLSIIYTDDPEQNTDNSINIYNFIQTAIKHPQNGEKNFQDILQFVVQDLLISPPIEDEEQDWRVQVYEDLVNLIKQKNEETQINIFRALVETLSSTKKQTHSPQTDQIIILIASDYILPTLTKKSEVNEVKNNINTIINSQNIPIETKRIFIDHITNHILNDNNTIPVSIRLSILKDIIIPADISHQPNELTTEVSQNIKSNKNKFFTLGLEIPEDDENLQISFQKLLEILNLEKEYLVYALEEIDPQAKPKIYIQLALKFLSQSDTEEEEEQSQQTKNIINNIIRAILSENIEPEKIQDLILEFLSSEEEDKDSKKYTLNELPCFSDIDMEGLPKLSHQGNSILQLILSPLLEDRFQPSIKRKATLLDKILTKLYEQENSKDAKGTKNYNKTRHYTIITALQDLNTHKRFFPLYASYIANKKNLNSILRENGNILLEIPNYIKSIIDNLQNIQDITKKRELSSHIIIYINTLAIYTDIDITKYFNAKDIEEIYEALALEQEPEPDLETTRNIIISLIDILNNIREKSNDDITEVLQVLLSNSKYIPDNIFSISYLNELHPQILASILRNKDLTPEDLFRILQKRYEELSDPDKEKVQDKYVDFLLSAKKPKQILQTIDHISELSIEIPEEKLKESVLPHLYRILSAVQEDEETKEIKKLIRDSISKIQNPEDRKSLLLKLYDIKIETKEKDTSTSGDQQDDHESIIRDALRIRYILNELGFDKEDKRKQSIYQSIFDIKQESESNLNLQPEISEEKLQETLQSYINDNNIKNFEQLLGHILRAIGNLTSNDFNPDKYFAILKRIQPSLVFSDEDLI